MSTIRDVALRAGVAVSTVSAVINRSAPTSAAVVERVERAIAEIGYAPQRAAQTLRSGRSRFIGLIIPDITNPHFAALARVVENECLRAGYMTFVYNTDEDCDHEMHILRMMRMQQVAGLILISTSPDAQHGKRLMSEVDVPTVRKVLGSWGPGRFDAELFMDGKAFGPRGSDAAALIPDAFGLTRVNAHTWTADWGNVTYWSAFVSNLE